MFDLVFSTLSAFNQVATLVGALIFWGLGGLLVGNAVYWRRHAVRVQGEVIGVRREGNCLNAVYRYLSPSGETLEATSLEGSSSMRGKETGTMVPLWVIPEKPNEVQEAGNHIFTIIGVVLLGVGVALFWIGVTAWRTGPMTWGVASLAVVQLLRKLRHIIAPKDKGLPRGGWRELLAQMSAARAQVREAPPVQRVEELAALPEYRVTVVRQRAQLRRLAPFLLLAGIGMLALGVYQSRMLLQLQSSGARTPGTVTSLVSSSSSNGGVTYYPLVTYTDGEGRKVDFKDSTGTNPPMYHVGEAVTVLYLPGETGRAVIDRGVWNWLPSVILYVLGGAVFAGGLAGLRSRSEEVPLTAQS
jgi:hypothetical protein